MTLHYSVLVIEALVVQSLLILAILRWGENYPNLCLCILCDVPNRGGNGGVYDLTEGFLFLLLWLAVGMAPSSSQE